MTLALIGFGIATIFELLLWIKNFWQLRTLLAITAIGGLIIGSFALVIMHPSVWTALILILSGYRAINMMRIIRGRTAADYLFDVARGTTIWLLLLQVVILSAAWLINKYGVTANIWWWVVGFIELTVAIILTRTTIRNKRTIKPPILESGIADKDLPSLTVAIPARNETEDLSACLEKLIASTYPKLEILVLDDCSQNKRTPQIIRSFANAGVRFIAGQTAPPNWLAKNFAYEQLYNQSNGALILFCGVDARFEPDSLRNIVSAMLTKNKQMCCILPSNQVPKGLLTTLLQPSRYAWELGLPRRTLARPPVLSTCWIITRELIEKSGTFKSATRSIIPERQLALAATRNDGYSFMQSGDALGVSNDKSFSDQRDTAIRTRYPQMHRRPELVALVSLSILVCLVAPYGIVVAAIISNNIELAILLILVIFMLTIFYVATVTLTYRRFLVRSVWTLPLAALYDVWLLNYSMWKYEFSDVIWKGRNVCIPVMHVIPHLPPLPDRRTK